MRLLEILAQSSVPAKQCNYNASSNPKLSILCKLSRRNSNILITVFLLIHARIDLNQYYKKMVRLISISGLQYYCEEQGIV